MNPAYGVGLSVTGKASWVRGPGVGAEDGPASGPRGAGVHERASRVHLERSPGRAGFGVPGCSLCDASLRQHKGGHLRRLRRTRGERHHHQSGTIPTGARPGTAMGHQWEPGVTTLLDRRGSAGVHCDEPCPRLPGASTRKCVSSMPTVGT